MQVIVIGAGINGLLTARELVLAGAAVTVLEQGEPGREASWAGGGIVSPLYPWRYPPAVTALARWAQAAYPELAEDLRLSTGMDVELTTCGMLFLEATDYRDAMAWASSQGLAHQAVDHPDLHQRWPGLCPSVTQGLWLPEIANIRNPRLLQALEVWLQQRGVRLLGQHPVASISSGRVQLADGRCMDADQVVVCAGAWSSRLLPALALPIQPVRGQMLLYRLAPGALPCMVLRGAHYLIPRRDGHVLCGSTLEHAGFDKQTTPAALAQLRTAAAGLWPVLDDQQPIRQWAGLRPGSPNGIPFIGEVPDLPGVWLNAGQFRNGLVLAPASARLLADLMLQRPPALDPRPYRLS